MNADDPYNPALIPALRWMSNMMCLWGLCAKRSCRRAQHCHGDPRDCLARFAPLVPEDARDAVKAMIDGRIHRFDFDAVCEDVPDEIESLGEWRACVQRQAQMRQSMRQRL